MNDIQEAHFVAREMLPKGQYSGRLSVGVAKHLSRRLPEISLPSFLKLDVSLENAMALSIFAQSLSRKQCLQELYWASPLPLSCLGVLTECFATSPLTVLEVHLLEENSMSVSPETMQATFCQLASIAQTELRISLGGGWRNMEPILTGLQQAARQQSSQFPSVSLSMPYQNDQIWCTIAHQISCYNVISSLQVQGGIWAPTSWQGFVFCLQTPSLRQLVLSKAQFSDELPSSHMVRCLCQALLDTCLDQLHLINVEGSGCGGSVVFIETLLTSMSNVPLDQHGALYKPHDCCSIRELSLRTRLPDLLEGLFSCAVYTSLARHLPHMSNLRTLRTRSQIASYALLWDAIYINESLTSIDMGACLSENVEFELIMQRNRLLQQTRSFCSQTRSLQDALEYARQHELLVKDGAVCSSSGNSIMDTASSAYVLLRSCLPPNIKECQRQVVGRLSEADNPDSAADRRPMVIG